jgi:hypothetical protein
MKGRGRLVNGFTVADAPSIQQHEADAPPTAIHHQAAGSLDFSNTPVESKITRLQGDSLRFDVSPYQSRMGWIFT